MSVEIVSAYDHLAEIGYLFSEYTKMLMSGHHLQNSTKMQGRDTELEHLETRYVKPDGRLYLAYCDGEVAGCIGLRKLNDKNCEMKRLYVRPEFRGMKLGELLVKKVVAEARKIGYAHMLLDTLPFLGSAIHLYRKQGFYPVEQYNDNPLGTSIYMKLDLNS